MSTTKAISQAERSSIWMTRGDIVLQTENTQFRVNSDVLAQQSPLFAKMFELPQPPAETEPSVDGCPVIHVSDSARDWENILSVLYSPFRVREKISFDLLASMLRLGDKYDLSESKSYAIWRLRAEFPSELATWLGLRGGFSKIAGQVDGTGRILDLFQLAWQFRVQTCIPVIGYCCLNEIPMKAILDNEKVRDDGTHIALPALLKAQLVIALEELKEAQHKGFYWLNTDTRVVITRRGACTSETTCSNACRALRDMIIWGSESLRLPVFSGCWDAGTFPPVDDLCASCFRDGAAQFRATQRNIWAALPECFGLPRWETLNDGD